jgi:hypothetical protein
VAMSRPIGAIEDQELLASGVVPRATEHLGRVVSG